jgi:uncharacterized protein (TIGR02246 family)
VQELDAAWNARESARFSAVFSEDGSFGFPVEGIALRGRGEISRHYGKVFAKMPPDLRHLTTIKDFEIMNPDLVAVDFEVDILGTDSKTGKTEKLLVHYHGFGLGVRTDSGWRIRLARVYQVAKWESWGPAKVVADSGYYSEAHVKMIMTEGIDAYIADPQFRKRDPRFAKVNRYKERFRKEQRTFTGFADLFRPNRDFTMSEDQRYCICPAGKRLSL